MPGMPRWAKTTVPIGSRAGSDMVPLEGVQLLRDQHRQGCGTASGRHSHVLGIPPALRADGPGCVEEWGYSNGNCKPVPFVRGMEDIPFIKVQTFLSKACSPRCLHLRSGHLNIRRDPQLFPLLVTPGTSWRTVAA